MWNSFVLPVPPSEVPVDPTAHEARQMAEEELSRSVYNPGDSLFARIGRWIAGFFMDLFTGRLGATSPVLTVIILAIVAIGVVLAVVFASRVRRIRNVTVSRSHQLFDDARSAAQLRGDARAAAARGDFTAAFLDTYRAIIRSLDERVLIDDRPGLTAHEAALLAVVPFPRFSGMWQWAADAFDAGCYGRRTLTESELEQIQTLDRDVQRTRPERSTVDVPRELRGAAQ
ncbi:MAG TPA: DUF4129 domain-containing protein [Actinomycetaceae bacterium]|nr:DUF4129 domain-containing protein [Actinomycetaceae bacterium]